jgi:hypothetical protein
LKFFAAFIGICAFFSADLNTGASRTADLDARAEKLEAFFRFYGCPEPFHVQEYLQAADANKLDYRLLPAVSLRESTCGWYAVGNNHWGWNSARTDFDSVADGIQIIAHELSDGYRYRGKTLNQKLVVYNPVPHYAGQVRLIMRQVEPDYDARLLGSECQLENAKPAQPDWTGAGDALFASGLPPPGPQLDGSHNSPYPSR